MPLTPLPPTIELTNFAVGWLPKPDDPGMPLESLRDVVNLIIDPVTGTLHTRAGFKRLFDIEGQAGYRIYAMHPYTRMDGKAYIICVLSNDSDIGDNNIKVMALDLAAVSWTKISPDKNWNNSNGRHWGASVDGAFYGGGEADPMYRWFPVVEAQGAWAADTNYSRGDGVTKGGDTYVALRDHTSHDGTGGTIDSAPDANNRHARFYWALEWTDDAGAAVDVPVWAETNPGPDDLVRARDYAWKKGDVVSYEYDAGGDEYTKSFEAKKDIRYDKWTEDVTQYRRGDRVSYKGTWGYWRSYECTQRHTPEDGENQPGSGAGYWKKVKLMSPIDEDGEINRKHWAEIPNAPRTRIATWWANRLLARNDDGNHQTMVYSRQSKVAEKDNRGRGIIGKAGDPEWDPDDWRSGGTNPAGFQPFETAEGDSLQAIVGFGDYAVVFKRYSTFIISGRNPETWIIRQVADVGISYTAAACEHEGFVYFLSDRGFFRTEGTSVSPVPGADKVQHIIQDALDSEAVLKDVRLWSFGPFVWMTLPRDITGQSGWTLLYHPGTQSFWPLDLTIQAVCVQRYEGVDRLFFSTVNDTGTTVGAAYAWDGVAHRSKSSRTLDAVTIRNTLLNPNFQVSAQHQGVPHDWQLTDSTYAKAAVTKMAGRRGKGAHVSNKRKDGDFTGLFAGWEGIFQDHGDEDVGTHNVSVYVRRSAWEKHPKKRPLVRVLTDLNPLNILEPSSGDFTYKGNGWWRLEVDYTGSLTTNVLGFLIPPATDYHFDMAMAKIGSGPSEYIDGNGGTGNDFDFEGGDRPYIMLYDHPDADDQDDTEDDAGTMEAIPWSLETAWMTFGAVQEERRIRRLWSLIRGATVNVAMRTFSNFRELDDGQSRVTLEADDPMNYHEGYLPEDCHAIAVHVEGDAAPAAVLGVALDTEPRRIRFGRA